MKKTFTGFLLTFTCAILSAQPVSLHPENPHYLLFKGKPVVVVSSGEHYGSVINPDFDYIKYLKRLRLDGMNYTRLFSGTYFERSGSFGIEKNSLAPAPGRALLPWQRSTEPGAVCGGNKFDLGKWNEAYFARLKSFVSEASDRGIIVEISLFSSIYGYWDIQVWNRSNNISIKEDIRKDNVHTLDNGMVLSYQESFVRKIVKELNEFDNIIWEIQNEPWSDHTVTVAVKSEYYSKEDFADPGGEWRNVIDVADEKSLAWQSKIASFITDEEGKLSKKHLIAQNFCNFYFPVTEVNPSVSVMNFHYAYPVVIEQNYGYNRVISFDETGFAGSSDLTYRKQAWNFIMAGGGIFNNLDYSFATGEEDGTALNKAPGGGSSELRRQLKVLSDFINSCPVVRMKPNKNVIIQSPGVFTRALSDPGKYYAIYADKGGRCDLRLTIPGGAYSVEWVDTFDGSVIRSSTIRHPGGEITLSGPEYKEDIALRIIRL
jgi:hypothetical protein